MKNHGARPITPIIGNANAQAHTKKRNTSTRNARAYCGQDYEWHVALANLYDQGWPEFPHTHPEGNESKTQALKIKTEKTDIQGSAWYGKHNSNATRQTTEIP